MMMKKYYILSVFVSLFVFASAQTANDALVFGQQYSGGSARYMSMGGAFNALGGDFSTLSVNPAGIGVYRSSEFSLTTDLRFNNTTTEMRPSLSSSTTPISDLKANLNLNSVGYVINSQLGNSGLISLNFGIGYNRLKNYHKSYRAEAYSSPYSLTDDWARSINENGLNNSTTGAFVADQAYLLNTVRDGNGDILDATSPLLEGGTVDYMKDVVEEGRINEWLLSFGGNYDNTLYFGATFAFQDIDLKKEYFQSETFLSIQDVSNTNYDDYFNYYSEEKTSGVGIQAKFGLIYRPTDALRLGFAVHAPSFTFLTVEQYADINNNMYYVDGYAAEGREDLDSKEYRTISPYKLHFSAGYIVAKRLALDAEVDMVDYSAMRIMSSDGRTNIYSATNDAIQAMYKVAYNTRFGAEFKLIPMLSLRAGFAYTGSPFEDNIAHDSNNNIYDAADYVGARYDYSLGFGYRTGDYFLDFAYVKSNQSTRAFVFDDAISTSYSADEMDLSHSINRIMMTIGFKF